jgi:hypothetical protein
MNDHDSEILFADDDGDWEDPTEDCEAHPGIECEGDCPCRKDCCTDSDEETE